MLQFIASERLDVKIAPNLKEKFFRNTQSVFFRTILAIKYFYKSFT